VGWLCGIEDGQEAKLPETIKGAVPSRYVKMDHGFFAFEVVLGDEFAV
jgi:hypothetical protein